MIKKEIGLYIVLLMVVLTGWASGAAPEKFFIADEGDWGKVNNWSPSIPTATDWAVVCQTGHDTIVSITGDAVCNSYMGGYYGGKNVVTINGGHLTAAYLYLGAPGIRGEMYIEHGTVTDTGYEYMAYGAGDFATVDVISSDAVLEFTNPDFYFVPSALGKATLDILDGMVVLPGNVTDISAIDQHWDTWAWGKAGTLVYNYDTPAHPGMTEITAVNNPAAPKGLAVVPSGGLTVTEAGTTTYTIALNAAPEEYAPGLSYSVTVLIHGTGNVTADANGASYVIFDASNWNVPRTVTVTGIEDHVAAGDKNVVIKHALISNNPDPNAEPLHNSNVWVPVLVEDSGAGDWVVTESDGLTSVTEGGATDSFDVVMTTAPTNPVTITVDTDASQVTTDKSTITFTAANYATPQTVTVTAVNDTVIEAPMIVSLIGLSSVSLDPSFDDMYKEVAVTVYDNECGSWGYEPMDINKDCKVDFKDFAVLSSQWLLCTDPQGVGCVHVN